MRYVMQSVHSLWKFIGATSDDKSAVTSPVVHQKNRRKRHVEVLHQLILIDQLHKSKLWRRLPGLS